MCVLMRSAIWEVESAARINSTRHLWQAAQVTALVTGSMYAAMCYCVCMYQGAVFSHVCALCSMML